MCGINAIYAYRSSAPPVDREELVRTREAMHTRGPDAGGAWVSADGRVGLGHRRLSIIDLATGDQPMVQDGVALAFNGEAYDFAALREELRGLGHPFVTKSDTEVVLRAYLQDLRPRLLRAVASSMKPVKRLLRPVCRAERGGWAQSSCNFFRRPMAVTSARAMAS